MYYIETAMITRNIGRQMGEPHKTRETWIEEAGYASQTAALTVIDEIMEAESGCGLTPEDLDFCRFEYNAVFVSENVA